MLGVVSQSQSLRLKETEEGVLSYQAQVLSFLLIFVNTWCRIHNFHSVPLEDSPARFIYEPITYFAWLKSHYTERDECEGGREERIPQAVCSQA